VSLIAVAEDLAGEFSPRPLLERILVHCTELLGCTAGSISSVDEAAGTYRKEADIGVACQSGQVFPLTEGMTGVVVARRAPVWFERYDEVRGGHVPPAERATLRGVIGVPLEWRGHVIGACVVFSRDEQRKFGPGDAELLELFARHAAVALATARMHEAAEERVRAEAAASERDRLLGEVHDSLARRLVSIRVHLDIAAAELAAGRGQAILSGPVLARLHRGLRDDDREPLTEREREVRALMEQGLPDKVIAERLVLSIKTVEKHAGAVLRKTGARNRTELAARRAGQDR